MTNFIPTNIFGQAIGSTNLSGNLNLQQANATFVNQSGDILSGDLSLGNNKITNLKDPTNDTDAVNKKYVDINLSLSHPNITKDLHMNNNNLIFVKDPSLDHHGVNKFYVDKNYLSKVEIWNKDKRNFITNISSEIPFRKDKDKWETVLNEDQVEENDYWFNATTEVVNKIIFEITFIYEFIIRGFQLITSSTGEFPHGCNGDFQIFRNGIWIKVGSFENLGSHSNRNKTYLCNDLNLSSFKFRLIGKSGFVNSHPFLQEINFLRAVKYHHIPEIYTKPEVIRYFDYKYILDQYSPKFWMSGYYNEKIKIMTLDKSSTSSYKDLSGNELTITNPIATLNLIPGAIRLDSIVRYTSSVEFTSKFTFFLIAKQDLNSSGRIFASNKKNCVFGFWRTYKNCFWLDTNIYGVNVNQRVNNDGKIHLFIARNNNDIKDFWNGDTLIIGNTNLGNNSWEKITIGSNINNENGKAYVYEVLAFNKVLNNIEISVIKNIFRKYYDFVQ